MKCKQMKMAKGETYLVRACPCFHKSYIFYTNLYTFMSIYKLSYCFLYEEDLQIFLLHVTCSFFRPICYQRQNVS